LSFVFSDTEAGVWTFSALRAVMTDLMFSMVLFFMVFSSAPQGALAGLMWYRP
jgi:hypothetical protein